jgi:WD40 repeat protein
MVFRLFRKKEEKIDEYTTLLWSYETGGNVWDVSVSADGSYIAAGSYDKKVYFFNREGRLLWSYETGDYVESVSVSADGSYIAAGSDDRNVYFFNFDAEKIRMEKTKTGLLPQILHQRILQRLRRQGQGEHRFQALLRQEQRPCSPSL